jgi:hypothetical protein
VSTAFNFSYQVPYGTSHGILTGWKTNNEKEKNFQLSSPFVHLQISLQVKWELKNENGKDIVCALIPVKIM